MEREAFSQEMLMIFFVQLQVNVVGLIHDIGFAFGPIEIQSFMEYEFVGEDGKAAKTFVAMGTSFNDIFCLVKMLK